MCVLFTIDEVLLTETHVGAGAGAGPATGYLRLVVVHGACGTLPSPMTKKMFLAKVPMEPALAMFVWLEVGIRLVSSAPHRARHSSGPSTSSTVLRAKYTYRLCACACVGAGSPCGLTIMCKHATVSDHLAPTGKIWSPV